MKIAYVLNTYPQPSHSFIRRELQALEKQGFEITRIAMRRSEQALVDPSDREEAKRTSYVLEAGFLALGAALIWCFFTAFPKFLRSVAMAWRMGRRSKVGVLRHIIYLSEACLVLKRVKTDRVQQIHAHFGTNATTVARLVRALGGPPYSFTVHGPEEFDAPEALSLPSKLKDARFAVAISQYGCSQLQRWCAFEDWKKLQVVHCGIERDHFADVSVMDDQPLRLISIGRFVEQKGQMTLLHAIRNLDDRISLDLVGDGEMRPEFEAFIAQYELQDRVRLTGWLDETGVRAALNKAHLLVMPSFAEGLPMVIMEAMAAQRAVLATQIAGIPELVLDGATGWLIAPGDAEALADKITQIAGLPRSNLREVAKAGRARVLERHSVDQEAAKLGALFRAG